MGYHRATRGLIRELVELLSGPKYPDESQITKWEEKVKEDEQIPEAEKSALAKLAEKASNSVERFGQTVKGHLTRQKAKAFIGGLFSQVVATALVEIIFAVFGIPPGTFGGLSASAEAAAECACSCACT